VQHTQSGAAVRRSSASGREHSAQRATNAARCTRGPLGAIAAELPPGRSNLSIYLFVYLLCPCRAGGH